VRITSYQSCEAESRLLASLRAWRCWARRTLASVVVVRVGSGIGAMNTGVSGRVTLSFGAAISVLAQFEHVSGSKHTLATRNSLVIEGDIIGNLLLVFVVR